MTPWSTFDATSWQLCFCAPFLCQNVARQDNLLGPAGTFVMVSCLFILGCKYFTSWILTQKIWYPVS
jgi:hypothetical protein